MVTRWVLCGVKIELRACGSLGCSAALESRPDASRALLPHSNSALLHLAYSRGL